MYAAIAADWTAVECRYRSLRAVFGNFVRAWDVLIIRDLRVVGHRFMLEKRDSDTGSIVTIR